MTRPKCAYSTASMIRKVRPCKAALLFPELATLGTTRKMEGVENAQGIVYGYIMFSEFYVMFNFFNGFLASNNLYNI